MRVDDAAAHVVLEDAQSEGPCCRRDSGHLDQHGITISVIFQHSLNAPYLAFNPLQPTFNSQFGTCRDLGRARLEEHLDQMSSRRKKSPW